MVKYSILASFVFSVFCSGEAWGSSCKVFEDADLQGLGIVIPEGREVPSPYISDLEILRPRPVRRIIGPIDPDSLEITTAFGDLASSAEVDTGCRLAVYEHHEFGGLETWFANGVHNLLDPFPNDTASSFKCQCNKDITVPEVPSPENSHIIFPGGGR